MTLDTVPSVYMKMMVSPDDVGFIFLAWIDSLTKITILTSESNHVKYHMIEYVELDVRH
jgi:hypothetical protein